MPKYEVEFSHNKYLQSPMHYPGEQRAYLTMIIEADSETDAKLKAQSALDSFNPYVILGARVESVKCKEN